MAGEAEEFAALLRTLKERSGKSYGQLASRLRVSNSTLHRYCHGTTVPPSFAPAERLARLCGATPAELVDLHRRWLIADAARDQRVPSPVPARPRPETAPDLTARDVLPPAAPDVVRTTCATTVHDTTADDGADDAATEAAAAELPAGPARARTPWWRRPWFVIAGVAAVVTATAAVAVPTVLSGSRTAADPATGRHSVAPQGPGARPSASAASPLQVSVLDNNWEDPCGRWYLSDRKPGSMPAPPDGGDTSAWAARVGAVPAGHRRLELTLETTGDEPVVLHALYVHAHNAGAAPHGSAFNLGTGCGGGITPSSFAIDLDAAAPTVKPVPGTRGDATVPAPVFPLQVSRTQPQVLDIDAATKDHDVSWTLELLWSVGSAQGSLFVDDHGSPFRTAGGDGAPRYVYLPGDPKVWLPDTDPQDLPSWF
ncbi:helix-turn-helix domain-containing protein [Streptacidiphilus neutrinimicus]|uniref:helix-turn-helix domain-containing protein n=1 Tax=Streptacidiphilus neutrinimicus TaxID=105420 RepID=UPI0006940C36|nr:helix-turn-helix transcriptional regulator [Streptacidiphilus neutrinimicus]